MTDTGTTIAETTPQTTTEAPKKAPWYSLNPRNIGRKGILRIAVIVLLVISFSITPLWRLFWYLPIYSAHNFIPVKDTQGHRRAGWHWVDNKQIRVYALPKLRPEQAETIAKGVRSLLNDADLDFTVKVQPMPPQVLKAYEASIVTKDVNGSPTRCVDFAKLESQLIEQHAADPHADMLVVDTPIAEAWWAHGMATFTSGVGVLENDNVTEHLGKHESCHLMGYLYHDNMPLFVFGYPWEDWPWTRDTLMMLLGTNNTLSPRAHDALHYFWRWMEDRSGKKFLKER